MEAIRATAAGTITLGFRAVARHSFDLPTSLSPAKGCEKCSQSNQGARGRLGDKSDGGVGVGVAVGIDHQALGQEECLGDDGLVEIKQVVICLLYTSPSPRDLSTSRMPSSA